MQCGFPSCEEFITAVRTGTKTPGDCSFINRNRAYAFEAVQKMGELWPEVPLLVHPRPGFTGLLALNNPDATSMVIVTGNNEYTEQVVTTVFSTTECPFFLLFIDTGGNTVDMSMVYQTLTAERISNGLEHAGIMKRQSSGTLIIPGLAASLGPDVEKLTGWRVNVGPVCAAELPLFLSDIWIPPL